MEYLCRSEAETEALGARLAAVLSPGDVVAYRGVWAGQNPAFTGAWPGPGVFWAGNQPDLYHRQ